MGGKGRLAGVEDGAAVLARRAEPPTKDTRERAEAELRTRAHALAS